MKFIKQSSISPLEDNDSYFSILTINREKSFNAINESILKELIHKLDLIQSDKKTKAVIITGAGDKSFIAGADIKLMSNMKPDAAYEYSRFGHKLCDLIFNYSKPIIAAVNGYALGGGCEIALACHMRFSSNNAVFAQPEVGLGILAGWGGTQRLPKVIGYGNAYDLLLTGRKINAKEACKMGLVNRIFDNDLINNIVKTTVGILHNSPNAMSETIKSVNNSLNFNDKDSLIEESILFMKTFEHSDSKEGLKSFVNKKRPKF